MTITALVVVALLQVQAAPAARVGMVNGQVDLILPGETVVAHVGDVVLPGDRVHTLEGSSLTLATESGVTLVLRSGTNIEMKNANGEPVALLTEGTVNVRSSGKPARIETKYGQIVGTDAVQEFEVSYRGDVVQVLVAGGGVRAEVSDSSKVVFKNAYDFGARVYEAGSISPTAPRERSGTTVIIYPEVGNPSPRGRATGKRPPPPPPPAVTPK